jgi:hypothetical protein
MEWVGGTYRPRVDAENDFGISDQLIISRETTYTSGVIAPVALDADYDEMTPTSSGSWTVLVGDSFAPTTPSSVAPRTGP